MKILIIPVCILLFACDAQRLNRTAATAFDSQGHRGSRGLMPENTISAMLKAIDLGVTTLEMDVVISKDNKVVVSHDPHFHENITTTPQGEYLTKTEAAKHLLYSMTYDSIKKYDVGMKPNPDFPYQQKTPAYKPLLDELLQVSEKYVREQGKTIRYNIEIKSKTENDGIKHPPVEQFVDLVVNRLNRVNVMNRTIIQQVDALFHHFQSLTLFLYYIV
jgi:glycerophosphoryl diester phosphodiesterase